MIMLWLLSQTLGFALPARPSVAGQEVPLRVAWEQNQGGHHGYDAGSQSCVIYDAELTSATTDGFNDRAVTGPNIVDYDSCLVTTIRIVGSPRAPPVENSEFLAAKSGTQLARELGAAGEETSGIVVPKTRIPSLTGTASYRVPDELIPNVLLRDAKNVAELRPTPQLIDFSQYAQQFIDQYGVQINRIYPAR